MTRHPWVLGELEAHEPHSIENTVWPGGHSLRFRGFLGDLVPPDELVTSVRCVVVRDDRVLVCEDSHPATHIWPGGRREPGESLVETAVREVHEETGWNLDPTTIASLGVIHFEHTTAMPVDHPYPYPDFVQVVFSASGTPGPKGWRDKDDGYVERSYLADLLAVAELPITATERLFLDAALQLRGGN